VINPGELRGDRDEETLCLPSDGRSLIESHRFKLRLQSQNLMVRVCTSVIPFPIALNFGERQRAHPSGVGFAIHIIGKLLGPICRLEFFYTTAFARGW